MSTIANLLVQIKGDASNLQQTLNKGKSSVNDFEKSSISSFSKIAAALAAAFSVNAIVNGIGRVTDSIDHLNDISHALNIPVKDLQEFSFAAKLSGTDIDELTRSIKILTGNIGDAALGSNDVTDALRKLGLNVRFLKTLDPGEQFELVSEALHGMVNESESASLALKLFGRNGVNIVNNIANNVDQARRTFKGLGVALSDEQAKAVSAFDDSRDALSAIFEGIKQQTVAALAPAFKVFIDNIVETIKQYGGIKKVAQDVAAFVISTVDKIINFFKNFGSGTSSFTEFLESLSPIFKRLSDSLAPFISGIKAIFSALFNIATSVLPLFEPLIKKLTAVFQENFEDIKNDIKDFVDLIIESIQKVIGWIEKLADKLGTISDKVGIFSNIAKTISPLIPKGAGEGLLNKFLGTSSSAAADSGAASQTALSSIAEMSQRQPITITIAGDVADFLTATVNGLAFEEAVNSKVVKTMQDTSRTVGR